MDKICLFIGLVNVMLVIIISKEKLNTIKVILFLLNKEMIIIIIFLLDAPSALLSHADICKLRYQTTSFTALHGLTQSIKPPGFMIYNSSKT
jgi:hypothetical protein